MHPMEHEGSIAQYTFSSGMNARERLIVRTYFGPATFPPRTR